jgi:hypothetical protein
MEIRRGVFCEKWLVYPSFLTAKLRWAKKPKIEILYRPRFENVKAEGTTPALSGFPGASVALPRVREAP